MLNLSLSLALFLSTAFGLHNNTVLALKLRNEMSIEILRWNV